MQVQDSSQRLEISKKRLGDALIRLDNLIQKQRGRLENERTVRTQVIKDIDSHIQNLETILEVR